MLKLYLLIFFLMYFAIDYFFVKVWCDNKKYKLMKLEDDIILHAIKNDIDRGTGKYIYILKYIDSCKTIYFNDISIWSYAGTIIKEIEKMCGLLKNIVNCINEEPVVSNEIKLNQRILSLILEMYKYHKIKFGAYNILLYYMFTIIELFKTPAVKSNKKSKIDDVQKLYRDLGRTINNVREVLS